MPHDWSVELSFTRENAEGATAFLPGGIGWYRKTFTAPESYTDKLVRIEFDGVYNNAEVWINGHHLGMRPYGYTAFSYDLTPHLNVGGENVIAVKADRTAYIDCRWYPGSGIYRHVKLIATDKVNIPQYVVFVNTPVAKADEGIVKIETDLVNESEADASIKLKSPFLTCCGKSVAETESEIALNAGSQELAAQEISVANPKLWSVDEPNMYKLLSQLIVDGEVIDEVETKFGIREIHYDADSGFYLNGKSTLFKGVCLHHTAGLVGAAVPIGVWERRL